MRPFRSFLILLVFLVSLTWIFNIFNVKDLFPGAHEPEIPVSPVISDTPEVPNEADPADQLSSFLDSLGNSERQVRVMYYGDSQVEGDRMTFYLRQLLRKDRGGTGPGLFQPVMPVMYTKDTMAEVITQLEKV